MIIVMLLLDLIANMLMMCAIKGSPPTKDYKRIICATVILGATAIVELSLGVKSSSGVAGVINEVVMVAVVFCLSELAIKRFMLYYVISYLIVQMVGSFSVAIMGENVMLQDQITLIAQLIVILIVSVFSFFIVVVFKRQVDFSQIPKKILFSIAVLFVAVIIFTMAAYVITVFDTTGKFAGYFKGITIAVCIAVFVVAIELISLALKRRTLQEENTLLLQYNEQQQQYYELLLKKEEDTRRYRHDMLNHMICIDELLNQNDIVEAKNYISNITSDLNSSRSNLYHTGNRIADVIMSSILQNKSEDTKVTVVGQLRPELGISDHDLCIIISNILKNAVEAVNKQKTGDKYIKMQYSLGNRYLRIEEYNSIDESQVYNAQNLETSKTDKRHHGLGTKNIKMIAQKYKGDFTTVVKNNEFYLCVDIDTKVTKKNRE